jgi:hypothetical protein
VGDLTSLLMYTVYVGGGLQTLTCVILYLYSSYMLISGTFIEASSYGISNKLLQKLF